MGSGLDQPSPSVHAHVWILKARPHTKLTAQFLKVSVSAGPPSPLQRLQLESAWACTGLPCPYALGFGKSSRLPLVPGDAETVRQAYYPRLSLEGQTLGQGLANFSPALVPQAQRGESCA